MITRLAYVYIRFLFALEVLYFTASLSLHVWGLISEANGLNASYSKTLFLCGLVIGIPVFAFTKNGMWVDQIKSCPKWMWKGAMAVGVYTLLAGAVQSGFSNRNSLSEAPLTLSVGFAAIFICILYSVLYTGYLEEPEVVGRTILAIIGLFVLFVLFYHTGFSTAFRKHVDP